MFDRKHWAWEKFFLNIFYYTYQGKLLHYVKFPIHLLPGKVLHLYSITTNLMQSGQYFLKQLEFGICSLQCSGLLSHFLCFLLCLLWKLTPQIWSPALGAHQVNIPAWIVPWHLLLSKPKTSILIFTTPILTYLFFSNFSSGYSNSKIWT